MAHMLFPHSRESQTQDPQDPHSAGQFLLLKVSDLELVKQRVRDKKTSFETVAMMAAK